MDDDIKKTKIIDGKICGVAVIILDKHNNLLLLQRKDNKKWEPVKGGVWKEENDREAAIREVKEETNLDIKLERRIAEGINDEIIKPNGDKIKIRGTIWLGKTSKQTPDIILDRREHLNYKWLSLNLVEKIKEDIYPSIFYFMIKNFIKN